jgi:hypothetical protein
VFGNLDTSGYSGNCNIYTRASRYRGTFGGTPARLQLADRVNFGGLVTVAEYSEIKDCLFSAGMTTVSASPDLQPSGFYNTNFTGVFTGPASSLRLDTTTNHFFISNGASLAGGATKVYLDALATASESGILSSTDWSTFNNKAAASHSHVAADVSDFASVVRSTAIASSIVDGDLTHAPDGNSVFDALAGKSATGHGHVAADISDFASVVKSTAVADSITDAITDVAPSQNAVFDALALKLALVGGTMSGNIAMGGNKVTGLAAPTANGDALRYDQLGAVSGIATLDGSGKVPLTQLPSAIMTYEGVFDASGTPASPLLNGDGAANAGMVYRASVAGTYDFGAGGIAFTIGDYAIYNSSGVWEKSDSTDAVVSVNGASGIVTVNAINELTGDVVASAASGSQAKSTSIAASVVTGKLITGFVSGAGAVAATDTVLQAINKLDGNDAAKAVKALSNLASVAINESLISDTNNTDDLGSAGINWKDVHAKSVQSSTDLTLKANAGSNKLDVVASKVRMSTDGTNFIEDQYVDDFTLAMNTTVAAPITPLTFAFANFRGAIIDYTIKDNNSSKQRTGRMIVATDGSTVSAPDIFAETAQLGSALGLSLSAAIVGSNVEIQYNNTHATNDCHIRCRIMKMRA